MPPVPAAGRRLASLLSVAAAVLVPFAVAAPAAADETADDTVVGELVRVWPEVGPEGEHAHEDSAIEDSAHEPLSWVETAEGEAVPVVTADVAGMPVGATVELTLGASEETTEEPGRGTGGADARPVVAGEVRDLAPVAAATPSNAVTVVRVVPAGGVEDGTSLASLVDAIDGPVARFWTAQSGGAVRFGVTDTHPDWVATGAGCDDPSGLWAEAADAAGFEPGPGRHLVVYVSSRPAGLPGCAPALAQVGTGPGSGGRIYVRSALPGLIAHELGHNMGLGHSSGRQCDGALEAGTCRTAAYRDYYDVMGASWEQLGSLNAAQADRLRVLPADEQQALAVGDPAATVTLGPLGATSGTRALRLTASDGGVYWLEHRAGVGQDGWLSGPANRFGLDTGVLLHRTGEHTDTALLLDGTPSDAAGWEADLQAALPLGVPVPVGGGAFTVTVEAVTDAGATLLVQPAVRPVPAPPAVSGAGAPPEVLSGSATGAGRPGAAPQPTVESARQSGVAAPAVAQAALAVPAGAVHVEAGADAAPALEPRSQSSSPVWLLPLASGLAVTGIVLAGRRGLRRVSRARR